MDADLLAADERRRWPASTPRLVGEADIRSGTGCVRDPIFLHWYGQIALWHVWYAHEARIHGRT